MSNLERLRGIGDLDHLKEKFPTVFVNNEVLWVNQSITFPFDLRLGQSCDLGVFLVNKTENQRRTLQILGDDIHHRSGLVGTVLIRDSLGNFYFDLDLKGMGYIAKVKGGEKLRVFYPRKRGEKDTWGTWRKTKAIRERDILENLATTNARTNRLVAIISLKEIALPNGKVISVEEAKDRAFLREDEDPVVGLRVYRYRERIKHNSRDSLTYLEKGKKIVEIEIDSQLNWEKYLLWFAATHGNNLKTIQSYGYWHGYPSPQNTTFACELVDFGFGEGDKKLTNLPYGQQQQKKQLDFVHARDTLNVLTGRMSELNLIRLSNTLYQEVFASFDTTYQNT